MGDPHPLHREVKTLEDYGVSTAPKPIGGGWRYEQEHLGQLWRIPHSGSAGTGEKLVQAVIDFRASAGVAPGDPVAEVAEYIKRVSPPNDRFKGRQIGQPRVREVTPLIHFLRQWLDEVAAQRPRFVSNEDAQGRAIACLKCPQNIRWEVTGCGACNDEVTTRSYALRKSKGVAGQDALKGCRLHRIHLPAAVHLDRDFLPNRAPEAPAICWLPTENGDDL